MHFLICFIILFVAAGSVLLMQNSKATDSIPLPNYPDSGLSHNVTVVTKQFWMPEDEAQSQEIEDFISWMNSSVQGQQPALENGDLQGYLRNVLQYYWGTATGILASGGDAELLSSEDAAELKKIGEEFGFPDVRNLMTIPVKSEDKSSLTGVLQGDTKMALFTAELLRKRIDPVIPDAILPANIPILLVSSVYVYLIPLVLILFFYLNRKSSEKGNGQYRAYLTTSSHLKCFVTDFLANLIAAFVLAVVPVLLLMLCSIVVHGTSSFQIPYLTNLENFTGFWNSLQLKAPEYAMTPVGFSVLPLEAFEYPEQMNFLATGIIDYLVFAHLLLVCVVTECLLAVWNVLLRKPENTLVASLIICGLLLVLSRAGAASDFLPLSTTVDLSGLRSGLSFTGNLLVDFLWSVVLFGFSLLIYRWKYQHNSVFE